MQDQGFKPDVRTFVALLNACASLAAAEVGREMGGRQIKVKSLERGIALHSEILNTGQESNSFVATSLLDMYVKCGSLVAAQQVFNRTHHWSVVSWNIVIQGNAENGEVQLALELFQRMHQDGVKPDDRTFVAALAACKSLASGEKASIVQGRFLKLATLEKGMAIHSYLAKNGHDSNLFVGSSLVDMYAHCGSMLDARRIFDKIPDPDVVLWTALILGYVESDEAEEALELFSQLLNTGLKLDQRTYVAALMACSKLAAKEERKQSKLKWLETGAAIHSLVVRDKLETNLFVGNTLVDMYAKCGSMPLARRVFDAMTSHTVVSWTAMISGYVESDDCELALQFFMFLLAEGVLPDGQALIPVLMACSGLAAAEKGRLIQSETPVKVVALEKAFAAHSYARRSGHESNLFLASTLVDLYLKCGSLVDAHRVFHRIQQHNLVSLNTMIMGLAESGEGELALELFSSMEVEPDGRTYIAALSACGSLASDGKLQKLDCLEKGMKIHSELAKARHEKDLFVANTLLDMYSKCGSMADARRVFERILHRSLISWNAIITGYADNGESEAALELFSAMQLEQTITPNALTYVPVLRACGSLVLLHAGKHVHGRICSRGLSSEQLTISLVNFYGKCGRMAEAKQVFDQSMGGACSVAAWNSLVVGYSKCGDAVLVMETFYQMRQERAGADGVTLLAVLSACSHAGLVEEGKRCFELVTGGEFGVAPSIEHFNCVVDMLGRANQLENAVEVLERMPWEPDSTVWKTLLSACIKWKNLPIGKLAFERLQAQKSEDSASYVLMANLLLES